MTSVRLEPAAPRSRVKHSTTEPLRSLLITIILSLDDEHQRLKSECANAKADLSL